jgi:cyclohexa-1,5-dienecarbonyl-CoA hydratase
MTTQTQTTTTRLVVERSGLVARISLRHPPLNVIDIPMMEELVLALAEVESSPHTSTIVIRGDGGNFSAGVDVAAHSPELVGAMLSKFHTVVRNLVGSKKVTIAAVRGHCLGGGAELAMVCDLVFTTETAAWGFPEIKLGCYPPVAVTSLAALVGQKRASELVLTGRSITGVEAARIGLANCAVDEGSLELVVADTVTELQSLSPAALAATKKAIYAWDAMHFDKGLGRAEKIYLDELMNTADAQEGIRAFVEKRTPEWKGK